MRRGAYHPVIHNSSAAERSPVTCTASRWPIAPASLRKFPTSPLTPLPDVALPRLSLDPARPSAERAEALWWSQAWASAVLASAVAIGLAQGGLPRAAGSAVLIMAAPAAMTLLLRWRDTDGLRGLLIAGWAAAGTAACVLGGGISGPFGAAAAVLGGGRLVAEAAALAVVAVAVVAVCQALGAAPAPPPPELSVGLGGVALLTTAIGVGTGFLLAHRRARRRQTTDGAAYSVLERLLTEQPHLVLSLDGQGRVGSAFGYAPEGISESVLLGEGLLASAEPSDRPALETAMRVALARGQAEVAFAPMGSLHSVCALNLRRAADGRLVAVLRDATRERAREAALEAAKIEAEQMNTGKSRFLANMSHELRTPLNAIMGFSDIMRSRLFGPIAGKYGEYAELIHDSGKHLLDLINDVLDVSKIEADRYELIKETFDAREPVSAALKLVRLQADEAGISLRGVLPPQELEVEADRRALKQIVLNLVSNALKFTPRGGSVTVSLARIGGRVELQVVDTGAGIADDDLKRLGQPFEQAGDASLKAQGTGLGLSLVRAFAELHGGEMVMESELGEGTSVTVRLPILRQAERPTAQVIAFAPTAR
jgi:two-component system, cell cycle sensor histidine kinase DivJ